MPQFSQPSRHFEAVHPFRDGNGRVGRLLLPLMMAADRQIPLYLSPYIEAHKDDYYASLKAAQQRLWHNASGGKKIEICHVCAQTEKISSNPISRKEHDEHAAAH